MTEIVHNRVPLNHIKPLKIGIFNLEPKYINIALEKIKMFHEAEGDHVEPFIEMMHDTYDKIYASSIFSYTDKTWITPDMEIGGTGFEDLMTKTLPDEIEEMKPKINCGFTTRGCIRKCPFCVVPIKEGKIRIVGDIYDFWDRKSKEIVLHDNNILAMPEHFFMVCRQLKREKLKVDFNQGLDIRLLTDDIAKELKSLKVFRHRFAFDGDYLWDIIEEKCQILKKHEVKHAFFDVLVGFNSTIEKEAKRFELLKKYGHRGFAMQHKNSHGDRRYFIFKQWANHVPFQAKMTFWEWLDKEKEHKKIFTQHEMLKEIEIR